MTEDASPPEDTQEAERDDESSENATVADAREPVTVAPDEGEDADAEGTGDEDANDGDADDGDAVKADDGRTTVPDEGDPDSDADLDAAGGASDANDGPDGSDGPTADLNQAADAPTDAPERGAAAGAADAEGASDAGDTHGADARVGDVAGTGTDAEGALAEDAGDVEDGSDAAADEAVADDDSEDADAGDDAVDSGAGADADPAGAVESGTRLPEDVRKYDRFTKMDGSQYERVNEFLRERTYITAREWAIARLCADFRTETGVEMTKIGENLPHLVPFMTDTYTPQAVNQARSAFERKVRTAGATFLYGAMCDFFTADELDDLMYEVTEVAKFLLEVEGVDLTVEEELDAEERISSVMREVRRSSDQLRHEGVSCPECGHEFEAEAHDAEGHGADAGESDAGESDAHEAEVHEVE